eukprot:2253151-Ditylum_brightwellii.AAC.1
MTPTCKAQHMCREGISRLVCLDPLEGCQICKNFCHLGHAQWQVATCSSLLPLCAAMALSPRAVREGKGNR